MKRKDALIILIPSLIVVILWVMFSIYHNYINSTIPNDINMQISVINPDFDTKTINQLKSRTAVTPIYTIDANSPSSEQITDLENAPTPTVTPPKVSSPSARIATNGGTLGQ